MSSAKSAGTEMERRELGIRYLYDGSQAAIFTSVPIGQQLICQYGIPLPNSIAETGLYKLRMRAHRSAAPCIKHCTAKSIGGS